MAANPLQSLLPKDAEKGPDPNGMQGKIDMMNEAKKALTGGASNIGPEKHVQVGAPSPMKPVKGPYGSQPGEKRIDTKDWTKPLGQMHDGGTVPKTGTYVMKKDEKVLTPEDHGKLKAAMGLAHSVLSKSDDSKPEMPRHLKEMHIKELHTGGFHVTKHDGMGGMTEHGAPHNDAVVEHFMDHMAHPDEDEEAAEAGDHDMHAADAAHMAIGG
jgi:hypothetical protein